MANNELVILLRFASEAAARDSQQYHQGERIRIKQTADAQIAAERARSQSLQRSNRESTQSFNALLKSEQRMRADALKQTASDRASWAKKVADNEYAEASRTVEKVKQLKINVGSEEAKIARATAKEKAGIEANEVATTRQSRNDLVRFLKAKSSDYVDSELAWNKVLASGRADTNKEIFQDDKNTASQQMKLHQQNLREQKRSREEGETAAKSANAKSRAASEERMKALGIEKKGVDDVTKSTKDQESAVMGVAKAYTAIRIASEVAQVANAVWQTMGRSASEVRDYIHGIVQEMESARQKAQEIASLEGKKATAGYTSNQAREAAAAGSSPEDYQAGKLAFQAYAGQYVGKEGATDAERADDEKNNKISFEDAQKLQKDVATNAQSQGINQAQAQELSAAVISKRKKGSTVKSMEAQYARLMKVMKLAPGYTGPAISQLKEVIAEDVGEEGDFKVAEDAAVLTRVVGERNPEEASTYTRATLRGLRELRNHPEKMEELGIDKNMDVFQQMEQINKRTKEIADEEGDGTKQSDVLARYFKDTREFGGAMTAINAGIKGGAIARARKEMEGIDEGTIDKENKEYLESDVGKKLADDASLKAIDRENAARAEPLEKMRRQARMSVHGSRILEKPESLYEAAQTQKGSELGFGNREEQETRSVLAAGLEDKLMQSAAGRKFLQERGEDRVNANGQKYKGLGRRMAGEDTLIDADQIVESERRRSGRPMQEAAQADNGEGVVIGGKTDAEMMAGDRAAGGARKGAIDDVAAKLDKAAENLKQATAKAKVVGIPRALPARPPVQRH